LSSSSSLARLPRSHPPRLALLRLLPPALGAELLIAADVAEALTGTQLGPAA